MAWRMAISEGGVITGFLTCVEIGSASCSGGMRGWRYIEWQYNEGTLYIYFLFMGEGGVIKYAVIYCNCGWISEMS
jgi:hypothetical protein